MNAYMYFTRRRFGPPCDNQLTLKIDLVFTVYNFIESHDHVLLELIYAAIILVRYGNDNTHAVASLT